MKSSACHISVPALNAYGQAFKDNGYRLKEGTDDLRANEPGYWPVFAWLWKGYDFDAVRSNGQTVIASSARVFLARPPLQAPSCLVLGMGDVLPDPSGFELLRRLANERKEIPVVCILPSATATSPSSGSASFTSRSVLQVLDEQLGVEGAGSEPPPRSEDTQSLQVDLVRHAHRDCGRHGSSRRSRWLSTLHGYRMAGFTTYDN